MKKFNNLKTIRQLSEMYDISKRTIHQAIENKNLSHYRRKRKAKIFIRISDFEHWLTGGFNDLAQVA